MNQPFLVTILDRHGKEEKQKILTHLTIHILQDEENAHHERTFETKTNFA